MSAQADDGTTFEAVDILAASAAEERSRLCRCDRKTQIFAYAAIGAISLLVFYAFLNNLKFVEDSVNEKQQLEELVLAEADELDIAMQGAGVQNLSSKSKSQVDGDGEGEGEGEGEEKSNLYLKKYLDALEEAEVGDFGRESFWFVLDFDSHFWAMGGNPMLAARRTADGGTARPGAYSAQDMDETVSDNPIADFIRVAKRGGGYVEFRWKDSQPMAAYVTTLQHYPLVVGAAMPLDDK